MLHKEDIEIGYVQSGTQSNTYPYKHKVKDCAREQPTDAKELKRALQAPLRAPTYTHFDMLPPLLEHKKWVLHNKLTRACGDALRPVVAQHKQWYQSGAGDYAGKEEGQLVRARSRLVGQPE